MRASLVQITASGGSPSGDVSNSGRAPDHMTPLSRMPAVFGRQVICAVCLGLLGSGSSAPLQDPVLLSATTVPIRIGFDSPFADLKARLTARLADCGRTMPRSVEADPPGLWGAATAASIRAVLACPGFESILGRSLA